MSDAAGARYSPNEYLAFERASSAKHEYVDGVLHLMAGASLRHNLVTTNVVGALGPAARQRQCRVTASDMRLQVGTRYYYPDVMVSCRRDSVRDGDTETAPCLIFEVLSASTRSTDKREKLGAYTSQIDSLDAYVMIEPTLQWIETHVRINEQWTVERFGVGDSIQLPCLDIPLPVDTIYDGIDLE
jgi:Uma2 family endonuclease